jgi:hypothetical protein
MPPNPKPAPRKKISDAHLDDLLREVVFRRDGYRCWDCGRGPALMVPRRKDNWPTYPGFQLAHVFGRGRKSMQWIPENANCSCGRCHRLWHDGRFMMQKTDLFKERFPERYERLLIRSQLRGSKVDRMGTKLYLEQQGALLWRQR